MDLYMAVKWGSTTCTVIKWGSTTCTAVYWGGTLVFPDDYKANFTNIFTANSTSFSTATWKNSSPSTGVSYRYNTSGDTINVATLSGNTFYVCADYYKNSSGTWKNQIKGEAVKGTSSTLNFNGKSTISISITITGSAKIADSVISANGFGRFIFYYNSSAASVSSNKLTNYGTALSGLNNTSIGTSNTTVTLTGNISSLTGSYYCLLGFYASMNQNTQGKMWYTATLNSVLLT